MTRSRGDYIFLTLLYDRKRRIPIEADGYGKQKRNRNVTVERRGRRIRLNAGRAATSLYSLCLHWDYTEKKGYKVTLHDCTSGKGAESVYYYNAGELVELTAKYEYQVVDWNITDVVTGMGVIVDLKEARTSSTNSFTMPYRDLDIVADYGFERLQLLRWTGYIKGEPLRIHPNI